METRELGGTPVSRVILGCGNFGGLGSSPSSFGQGLSREQAFEVMDAAWGAGVTTFDTADVYGGGLSETWIGAWRRARGIGDEHVLSTKVGNAMGLGFSRGLGAERIHRQIDSSLRRLGVDRVPLYVTHAPDPETPLVESLAALDELVELGKVGAVGASKVDATILAAGLGTYRWVQNAYSLLDREPEREILGLCADNGLGFTPFSSLAGGWLTGKYARDEVAAPGTRMSKRPDLFRGASDPGIYARLDGLAEVAGSAGVDRTTLSYAWLFAQPLVTAVIIGLSRPDQLKAALRALEFGLSPSDLSRLDSIFAVTPTPTEAR
jgi:aryl-alcohol dehydrogenase-like predicted oxidoreductase